MKEKPKHPGAVLKEEIIKPSGLTVTHVAKRLGITRKALLEFLNCRSSLSPEMAVRIAKATGTNAEKWFYLQVKQDLWKVRQKPFKVQSFFA